MLDESDTILMKYVNCNHCGVVHKVYDVCKSEIVVGKEDLATAITIDDVKLMLPQDIVGVLESYNCDLPSYEHALFILQHKKFEEKVILNKEVMEEEVIGKCLKFSEKGIPSIESFLEKFDENF
jgi:cell division ATPase FtsA